MIMREMICFRIFCGAGRSGHAMDLVFHEFGKNGLSMNSSNSLLKIPILTLSLLFGRSSSLFLKTADILFQNLF
jgi:hypothetical protein